MADRNRNGIRENIRLSGPGSRPLGLAVRTQYAVMDAAYVALRETVRYVGMAVLAGVTLLGAGTWAKNKLSEGFNSASLQTSAASVAIPLTKDFSPPAAATPEPMPAPQAPIAKQITPAPTPQNPPSVREGLPYLPPTQALNHMAQPPAAKAPVEKTMPAPVAQMAAKPAAPAITPSQSIASTYKNFPSPPPAQAMNHAAKPVAETTPPAAPAASAKSDRNMKSNFSAEAAGNKLAEERIVPEPIKEARNVQKSIVDKLSNYFMPHYWTKNELLAKVREHTEDDPITYADMKNLIQSESGFNPTAESHANAKGLGQHVPQSQLGDMWTYKHALPPYAAKLAEGIVKEGKHYSIKAGADEKAIWKAIEDPNVSIPLSREHFRATLISMDRQFRPQLEAKIHYLKGLHNPKDKSRIAEMERQLFRRLTPADGKIGYVAGPKDGADFMLAYADPVQRKYKVSDFVNHNTVMGNPDIFLRPGTHKKILGKRVYIPGPIRTVEETMQRAIEIMGNRPLPSDLSRPVESRIARSSDNPDFKPS